MARRARLGITTRHDVACRDPTGHLQATPATHHPRPRVGGRVAPGCPQRPDGRAVGCGQPGACLGGWWWLGTAHPVWTAGHLWGVSCPPTMGTPRDRAWTRPRPQQPVGYQSADGCGRGRSRKTGWARLRPRHGAGRFAAVAQTVCARPIEGAHTQVAELPPVWVHPSWPCRTRASTEPAPCRVPLPTAAYAAMRKDTRHASGTFQLTHGTPRPT